MLPALTLVAILWLGSSIVLFSTFINQQSYGRVTECHRVPVDDNAFNTAWGSLKDESQNRSDFEGFSLLIENSSGTLLPSFKSKRMAPTRLQEPLLTVLISEVNFDNVGENLKQFIELEVIPKKKFGRPKNNMLEGFFILLINSDPLQVVSSIHLGDSDYNIDPFKRYLVLGSPAVDNVNININGNKVPNTLKNSRGNDLLPDGNRGPVGIAIAYQPNKRELTDLTLFRSPDGRFLPTDLSGNEHKKNLIRSLLVDFILVGRKAPVSTCSFFDSLFPTQTDSRDRLILRDWEVSTETIEHSLSRCSHNENSYQASNFKISNPTPGLPNDCSGLHLNLEVVMNHLTPDRTPNVEVNHAPGCSAEYPNVPSSRYEAIVEDKYKNILSKYLVSPFQACSAVTERVNVTGLIGNDITTEIQVPGIQNHTFLPEWKSQCSKYLPNRGSILSFRHISEWVDIQVKETECRFSCFYCKLYFEHGFRKDYKHKSNLMQAKGFFSQSPSAIRKALEDHSTKEIHVQAYQYGTKMKFAKDEEIRAKVFNAERKAEFNLYLPTLQVLQFVYAETRADVSFNKHSYFMSTLSKLGLNVGSHHFTDKAAQQFMSIISKGFHHKFLNYMMENKPPFSIIVDGTTYKNIPYLVILLQVILNARPTIIFYALLPLENEKGKTMADTVRLQVSKDNATHPGFEDVFKSSIIAQVSDSASSMVSLNNSLYSHLSDYVGKKIALVKCASHKTQLALKSAMQSISQTVNKGGKNITIKYFETFGKTNNKLYSFYFSRGSKRFQHLSELSEEMGLSTVRLKYYFDIRWASSHKKAMSALKQDYDALVLDLLSISNDKSFDKQAREKALALRQSLVDKTFAVTLNEFVDILEIFESMSLNFQKQTGLLTAKIGVIEKAIVDLAHLKLNQGKALTMFLAECKCVNVCDMNCTLQQYDDCPVIIRKHQELQKTNDDAIKLSEHRDNLYDSLISEIRRYFPMDTLRSFNIFDQRLFKFGCAADCSDLKNCYTIFVNRETNTIISPSSLMKNVCEFYFISQNDCRAIERDWATLLNSLLTNSFLIDYQYDDPSLFWPLAMNMNNIAWTTTTRQIIQYFLSTAFSSSDAERAFSITTSIQYRSRSALSSENLDMIARIKINGPEDVDMIDASFYTTEFLKTHGRVDDLTIGGGRHSKPEKFQSMFKRADIF